jgi:hypothetical protein
MCDGERYRPANERQMAVASLDRRSAMTDPRNVAHDKRVKHKRKHGDPAGAVRPGMKPHQVHHQNPGPTGQGPDSDEPIDQTELPQQAPEKPH